MDIRTTRCRLRLFTLLDAEVLLPVLGSVDVMRYSMTGPMDLQSIRQTLEQWITLYGQYGFGPWAVMHEGQLIGYAGLDIRIIDNVEQVQITFRLAKEYWGKGLATELATAVRDYAFNTLRLHSIIAIINPSNVASERTLTKIGMQFEKAAIYGGLPLYIYHISNSMRGENKIFLSSTN